MAIARTIVAGVVVSVTASFAVGGEGPVVAVPRVDGARIDGELKDWGDRGYVVEMLTPAEAEMPSKADSDAALHVGWNDEGLALGLRVLDDRAIEGANVKELWRRDSVEVFVSGGRSHGDAARVLIAPGMDPRYPALRVHAVLGGGGLGTGRTMRAMAERSRIEGGYVMEVLVPWAELSVVPALGRTVACQVIVYDSDIERGDYDPLVWYPGHDTSRDLSQMHRLRLSERTSPSPAVVYATTAMQVERLRAEVVVVTGEGYAGKRVALVEGRRTLAEGTLAMSESGRVTARLGVPTPPAHGAAGPLEIAIDGKRVESARVEGYSLRPAIEELVLDSPLARPAVFHGDWPEVSFDRPLWVERLIGPYTIETTYYDKDYNVVTSPGGPGRYGAIVAVTGGEGHVYRWFLTLYQTASRIRWGEDVADLTVAFRDAVGIDPAVVAQYSKTVSDSVNAMVRGSFARDGEAAVLLAGLSEASPTDGKDDYLSHPRQRDRRWWLGLKRKLYGWDKRYTKRVVCPRPIEGKPAVVLREGTPVEAGMKADAAAKIDAVLTTWSKDTDEAFAVCVARHGVIVLHKAYGLRDGKPMTVTTKSRMASLTKLLSGTLIMTLVDQGQVRLEDRADAYLPPLRSRETNAPMTLRHLYTHTADLNWHWGDYANDMEERIVALWPYLSVGTKYAYNGTDMALACKVLEAVSGETLTDYFRKHLLDPLGCVHTEVTTASHDARSVPLDMAKVAQMLLNKGAYGDMRFMRPETFEQMLPRVLTDILGPDATMAYGIGTLPFPHDGLGVGTFGHTAASVATLRIDPEHDLVISMTRNSAGRNFVKYHAQFLEAIVEGLAD